MYTDSDGDGDGGDSNCGGGGDIDGGDWCLFVSYATHCMDSDDSFSLFLMFFAFNVMILMQSTLSCLVHENVLCN